MRVIFGGADQTGKMDAIRDPRFGFRPVTFRFSFAPRERTSWELASILVCRVRIASAFSFVVCFLLSFVHPCVSKACKKMRSICEVWDNPFSSKKCSTSAKIACDKSLRTPPPWKKLFRYSASGFREFAGKGQRKPINRFFFKTLPTNKSITSIRLIVILKSVH